MTADVITDRLNEQDVRAILCGGRDRGMWYGGDGLDPVPAGFEPTVTELGMLLRVDLALAVEVQPESEAVYERLLWVGALRVDVGPTVRYVPGRSFRSALLAVAS